MPALPDGRFQWEPYEFRKQAVFGSVLCHLQTQATELVYSQELLGKGLREVFQIGRKEPPEANVYAYGVGTIPYIRYPRMAHGDSYTFIEGGYQPFDLATAYPKATLASFQTPGYSDKNQPDFVKRYVLEMSVFGLPAISYYGTLQGMVLDAATFELWYGTEAEYVAYNSLTLRKPHYTIWNQYVPLTAEDKAFNDRVKAGYAVLASQYQSIRKSYVTGAPTNVRQVGGRYYEWGYDMLFTAPEQVLALWESGQSGWVKTGSGVEHTFTAHTGYVQFEFGTNGSFGHYEGGIGYGVNPPQNPGEYFRPGNIGFTVVDAFSDGGDTVDFYFRAMFPLSMKYPSYYNFVDNEREFVPKRPKLLRTTSLSKDSGVPTRSKQDAFNADLLVVPDGDLSINISNHSAHGSSTIDIAEVGSHEVLNTQVYFALNDINGATKILDCGKAGARRWYSR